jgi:DNA-binding transcriptional regulator of glucitol operon
MSGLGTLFTVLGIAWAVQLYLAWRQAHRFQKQLASLRKSIEGGIVAIGVGGKRYRGGRSYVALVANQDGVVSDGLLLTGITVMAKGKPFTDYKGFHIKEIISGDRVAANRKQKVTDAARMAAEHIDAHITRSNSNDAE